MPKISELPEKLVPVLSDKVPIVDDDTKRITVANLLAGLTRAPVQVVLTEATALPDGDATVLCQADVAFVLTLPDHAACLKRRYTFKKVDVTYNTVTIVGTIDGTASYVLDLPTEFVSLKRRYTFVDVTYKTVTTASYVLELPTEFVSLEATASGWQVIGD